MNTTKNKPVITLSHLTTPMGPLVSNEPQHLNYLVSGVPHYAKIKPVIQNGLVVAMMCPRCGQATAELYASHRGLGCDQCPIEDEE